MGEQTTQESTDVKPPEKEKPPRWVDWPIVREMARRVILGPTPPQHASRVLVIGTYVEDDSLLVSKKFKKYLKSQDIEKPEVIAVKSASNIAVNFFGLSPDGKSNPTLPRGILLGTRIRHELGNNNITLHIDQPLPDYSGIPSIVASELCRKYGVPLIKYTRGIIRPVDPEKYLRLHPPKEGEKK